MLLAASCFLSFLCLFFYFLRRNTDLHNTSISQWHRKTYVYLTQASCVSLGKFLNFCIFQTYSRISLLPKDIMMQKWVVHRWLINEAAVVMLCAEETER